MMSDIADVKGLNPDPITGAPGSHPIGTAAGAGSAAAAGAAIGVAVGGPVGFVVGGTVGAIVGAAVGHTVAEDVNPSVEDAYWRDNYSTRPYVVAESQYSFYQPAYRYGWESRGNTPDGKWIDVETSLEEGWAANRGMSTLAWKEAMPATRDAWSRFDKKQD
jgi:outer membrane lipoprotein SlyB